jgi:phage tail sheath protein FI
VGNVCGDHARTDNDVNPAQASAGIQYGQLNCLGLERIFTENEVGSLYDVGVNCLVDWPNTGRVIWGCRNTEINGDLPFINMSRAYKAVNKVLVKTLYPYVFKSNTESLWTQIKLNVEAVLVGLHNSNWFAGKTPAESFEVICDKTNNNTANNYIEVEVGVAFQKPAEFIKLIIRQKLTSRS